MKKDAWELHRLETQAIPTVLARRWEARAGIKGDAPLRMSRVSTELKSCLSQDFVAVSSSAFKIQQGLQTLQQGGNWVSSAIMRGRARCFPHYCEAGWMR